MSVSIVIPIYNEAPILTKHLAEFISCNTMYDFVLVENGSIDGSDKLCDALSKKHRNVQVIHQPSAGFGPAVRAGILAAKQNQTVLLNADWLDEQFIHTALPLLNKSDIIVGNKSMSESHDERPWVRKKLSNLLNFFLKHFFNLPVSDTHGIKAFRTKPVQNIIKDCLGNELIETELIMRAHKQKLSIMQVPVSLHEERAPRIGLVRRSIRMGRELIKLKMANK